MGAKRSSMELADVKKALRRVMKESGWHADALLMVVKALAIRESTSRSLRRLRAIAIQQKV